MLIHISWWFSVILHGSSRTTGDMDIWVERNLENYQKIKLAFLNFWNARFRYDRRKFPNS